MTPTEASKEVKPVDNKVSFKDPEKEKTLAFKAFKSFKYKKFVQEESDDDEVEELTSAFRRFITNNKRFTGNVLGTKKKGDESSTPRCYKCNSKENLKPDCPLWKKEKDKYKGNKGKDVDSRVCYATSGDNYEDMLSSDDEDKTGDDGFKNDVCFVAIETPQVISEPQTDISFDDLAEKYTQFYEVHECLFETYEDMAPKFCQLRKEKKGLVGELASSKYELESMSTKFHEMKDLLGSYDVQKIDALEVSLEEAKSHIAKLIEAQNLKNNCLLLLATLAKKIPRLSC